MTENPYSTPSCLSVRTDLHRRVLRHAIVLPACFVAICIAGMGAIAGYSMSFSEENLENKLSVIVFCSAAGSIIGLGCGYLTARVLCGAIPIAYASGSLVVIVVGLLLTRNANYVGAAHLIAYLTIAGIILLNAVVFVSRRMYDPVIDRDALKDARTNR